VKEEKRRGQKKSTSKAGLKHNRCKGGENDEQYGSVR